MTSSRFSLLKRAGTLFLCFYLFLFMFPFPLDQIPVLSNVCDFYEKILDSMAVWFGKSILHLPDIHRIENTGSGDTPIDYVRALMLVILAVIFTIVLFSFDRKKRRDYVKPYSGLMIYARYYLGFFMLIYAAYKFYEPGQFDPPGLFSLEKSLGNNSKMGLLWSFMGSSKGYRIFSGVMELSGGYLLLFRRTKVIGAILTLAVMINVTMLNFCYDVSVKLFSIQLVLVAFIILWPDLKKIFSFLLGLNQEKIEYLSYKQDKKYKRILYYSVKGLVLIYFTIVFLFSPPALLDVSGQDLAQHKLAGVYKPTLIVVNNDTIMNSRKDRVWKKLMLEDGFAAIENTGDSLNYFKSVLHEKDKTLTFISEKDSAEKYTLSYLDEKGKFTLSGNWKGNALKAVFRKRIEKDYFLMNQSFHWVQEYPLNNNFSHR